MRILKISLMFIILLMFVSFTQAATIHVPKDYPTIQKGVDASSNGDTVLVADGTYKGMGNVNLDFKGKAITLKSENGATKCIIDCEKTNETRGIYFHSGETLSSVLDGFTIKNGNSVSGGGIACGNSSPKIINNIITSNSGSDGGGIYCGYSSPTISNNTITGNSAVSGGGGIYCLEYSSPLIESNIISKNKSGSGGGIGLWKHLSHPSIINNTITENFASSDGGGINCSGEAIKIDGNIITKNIANSSGGGISGSTSSVSITNNDISENSANLYGGGISCDGSNINNNIIRGNKANSGAGIVSWGGSPTLVNNTIVNNSAISKGGAILYSSGSLPMITNTILWNNKPQEAAQGDSGNITISYSDIQGGKANISGSVSWLDGNMDADPLFINAANNDYHLKKNSPCVNAGTMTLIVPEKDTEGNPRPNPPDSKPDIGAYEYQSVAIDKPSEGDINTGLVGYWPFDEGVGNVAKDLSEYKNNGTIKGSKWIDGKFGKALSFNGTSDYVEVSLSNSLNVTSITVEAWIKFSKGFYPGIGQSPGIINKCNPGGYLLYLESLFGTVDLYLPHGDAYIRSGKYTKWDKDVWYHVAATYDERTGEGKSYVNGVLVSDVIEKGPVREKKAVSGPLIKNNNNLFIGRYSQTFDGVIDEVAIYNRVLTNDEINQDMNNGVMGNSKEVDDPPTLGKIIKLYEDDSYFKSLLTDNEQAKTNIKDEKDDVFNGQIAINVSAPQGSNTRESQKFSPTIPGWNYRIVEKPSKDDEARWIMFAWKKIGGTGIMMQLANNGNWGKTTTPFVESPAIGTMRYIAGDNLTGWSGIQVSEIAPIEWGVVIRDLYADFGAFTLTGIALTPFNNVGLFDSIYLGQNENELRKLLASFSRNDKIFSITSGPSVKNITSIFS